MGIRLFLTFLFIFVCGVDDGFSQAPTPTPRPSVNRLENVRPLNDNDGVNFSRRTSPENLPPEYRVTSKALKKTKFSDEEKESYKSAKKNGVKILKLFIAPGCADKLTIDVSDPRCAENYDYIPISYYSFFDGVYGQLFGEFRIVEDLVIAGNGQYVHGIFLDLGETEIALLDKKSASVIKLADYEIAKSTDDAAKQKTELENGISYDGETISSRKKIITNHVYLMRIIAYGQESESISPYNYNSIVAFKVDKLTEDNMAIILWKKISEKTAPRLKGK